MPWLARLVAAPGSHVLPADDFAKAILGASAAALLALLAFSRAPARALAVLVLIAACAFVGVAAVAAVAATTLSATVLGSALLARFAVAAPEGREPPSLALCTLVGSALWMGVVAATLPLPVHTAPFYVLALATSFVVCRTSTRDVLLRIAHRVGRDERASTVERASFVMAAVVAIVHAIVVAKPEVGFDASTMHLQFAQLVEHARRWPFDVTRYAWAVMPMGADDAYLAAFLLGGERAARLSNLVFGLLLCAVVYEALRLQASRVVALASVTLLASTPLAFLESGTLFVEFAWTAFLVAALFSTIRFATRSEPAWLAAALVCCAGAMACKVIGVFWVAPLALALAVLGARSETRWFGPLALVLLVACAIGSWPYANAWARTGNPVFPFMNELFGSPYFPPSAFNNPLYNAPLSVLTPYDLVLASGRYIEGRDGAMGIQWLLLYPLVALGLAFGTERRLRAMLVALALAFGVAVYAQQSYLRYLLPAFALVTIVAGWSLGDWLRSQKAELALVGVASAVAFVNIALMPTASWPNETLCLRCALDPAVRNAYVATYAPLRKVSDWLNANLPDARVGFLVYNAPAPDGYVGYSRAANWHDAAFFYALAEARGAEDVAALVRRFDLTHAVFVARSNAPLDAPLLAYRDRDTTVIAHLGRYVVAAIRRDDGANAAGIRKPASN